MSMESDIAISTRVRLARNFEGYPFPHKLQGDGRRGIINKVNKAILEKNSLNIKFNYIDMGAIDPIYKQSLVEKHLISPEFLAENRPAGILKTHDEKISIMVNEEDHLRIQCIFPGLDLQNAKQLCMDVEVMLEKEHSFAFDPRFGYLTTCPTNIGTGLRGSVMLHLPALVMTGYIKQIIQGVANLGLTARGLYGENSEAAGNMFQISNQKTLGKTEESIINNVNNIALQIIQQEKNLREEIYTQNKIRLQDKVFRALGTLKGSRIMGTDESLKLLSDVRLGVDMGIIADVTKEQINNLLVAVQPGSLQKIVGSSIGAEDRDVYRANVIRQTLGSVE